MKIFKIFAITLTEVFLFSGFIVSTDAAEFTIQKATETPVIDGKLDSFYGLINEFYKTDGFATAGDPDKTAKGSFYATWDEKNLYAFGIVYAENHDAIPGKAIDMGTGSAGYIAILSTEPGGGWTDESRIELGACLNYDGTLAWKTCSPADIKDSSDIRGIYSTVPFKSFVLRDEAAKITYYEFAIPWTLIDRTGTYKFAEGKKITLNYSFNLHTNDEYANGTAYYVEFGGGIWSGSYENGSIATLGAAPVIAEPEPETAEAPADENPETADFNVLPLAANISFYFISIIIKNKIMNKQ
jgi:hypothetical protein